MVVTACGTHANMTEVDIVRVALIQTGFFTPTVPTDDWIAYYLRQGKNVAEILDMAMGGTRSRMPNRTP